MKREMLSENKSIRKHGTASCYLLPGLAAAVSVLVDTSPMASHSASPAQRLPARGNTTFIRGTGTSRRVTNAPVPLLPSLCALPLLRAQLWQLPPQDPSRRAAWPRSPGAQRALTVVKHGACREGELRVVFCLAGVQSSRLPQWRAAERKHLLTLKPHSGQYTKAAPSCSLGGPRAPALQGSKVAAGRSKKDPVEVKLSSESSRPGAGVRGGLAMLRGSPRGGEGCRAGAEWRRAAGAISDLLQTRPGSCQSPALPESSLSNFRRRN